MTGAASRSRSRAGKIPADLPAQAIAGYELGLPVSEALR